MEVVREDAAEAPGPCDRAMTDAAGDAEGAAALHAGPEHLTYSP